MQDALARIIETSFLTQSGRTLAEKRLLETGKG